VHAQLIDPNESFTADLFIAVTVPWPGGGFVSTNMLLIDEGQLGLMPHDDLDAVIVRLLIDPSELEQRIEAAAQNYNPVPPYSTGYGFDAPLLGPGEAAVGFSVDTSSIGLVGTAVDFECRMDGTKNQNVIPKGSGWMEQAGDIFFSNLTPPPGQQAYDPGTGLPYGTNYLWFEEQQIGLDPGTWTFTPPGPSWDLGDLPDELNGLDSLWYEEEEEWPGEVKWLQPPDDSNWGIDIRCDREDGTMRTLADDFECNTPGAITDVHIWGSWKYDIKGKIKNFHLSIHENIPDPTPSDPDTYSMPGRPLWERDINDFNEILYYDLVPADDWEWWWDPYQGVINQSGDQKIWQYDIFIDPCDAIYQCGTEGDPCIYWLDVWVDLDPCEADPEFGWKTSYMRWMDDAAMEISDDPCWAALRYPPGHPLHEYPPDMNSVNMAFAITTTDCFPPDHPDYSEWVYVGRPYCWCFPRQCHGDVDDANQGDAKSGYYYVWSADLNMLVAGWKQPYSGCPGADGPDPDPLPDTWICADFDHAQQGDDKVGYFRVWSGDLNILVSNWKSNPLPDCP
jgi:hypothetical protein